MTKVLILYYSAYCQMERTAQAVAEGVRDAAPKLDQKAPIATIAELADYEAIISGRELGSEFHLADARRIYHHQT